MKWIAIDETRGNESEEEKISPPFGTNEARGESDDAEGEDSEEGSKSSPFGITEACAKSDGDARLIIPKSTKEVEALEAALGMTRVHYWNLTGEFAPSPPPFENYIIQWRFLQGHLNFHWIKAGLSGDPPSLFMLNPWGGELGDWKYPGEQSS